MKQIIGFATQFYTLWNYEAVNQYRTDSYGNHHQTGVEHKYYYIKNISTDIDKVKTLFPNVEIDNELRGTSSFTRNEKLELPEGYFWGGKYAGKLIDEVIESDFQYCLWSAENYGGLTARYIKSHSKYIAHFEAIEKQKIADIEKAETVKVGDVIDLEFVSNGYNADDDYTECSAEARLGETVVYVKCSGVKPVNGMYPYLMPEINGKAQRTKGKKFSVKVIEVIKTEIYGDIVEQHIKIA